MLFCNFARGLARFQKFTYLSAFSKATVPRENILPFAPIYNFSNLTIQVYSRLLAIQQEYQKLNDELNSDKVLAIPSALQEEMRKRFIDLSTPITLFEKYSNTLNNLNELQKLLGEAQDKEEKEFAKEEIRALEEELKDTQEKILRYLLGRDKFDNSPNITIEIRPGVGGSESSLFADDVLAMFQNYFSQQGWSSNVLSYHTDNSIGKGCKLAVIKVSGEDVYKKMKCESGVHKVIRVPETDNKGRLHSSTISVVVLPEIPLDFKVNEKELKFELMRASGPGGQHVNKTESACRITHIPTGISVHIQDDRSQQRNRQKALEIITDKLFAIEVGKTQDFLSSSRKEQIATADRSDKIRTYNFPQSRITDHRTNLTLYGIEKMLSGEYLDKFIEEYLEKIYREKLESFLEEIEK